MSIRTAVPTLVAALALASIGCTVPVNGTSSAANADPTSEEATRADVIINGKPANARELDRLEKLYAIKMPSGRYWHDPRSGVAGVAGGPSTAFAPGFDFGKVAADASNGDTKIFYNGRELPMVEALFIASLYDIPPAYIPQFAGDYRLEATGDLYRESDGQWLGNLAELARQKGKVGGSGDGMWCGGSKGGNGQTCGNSGDGCSYVSIPSSTPSPTGVPNRIDVSSGC